MEFHLRWYEDRSWYDHFLGCLFDVTVHWLVYFKAAELISFLLLLLLWRVVSLIRHEDILFLLHRSWRLHFPGYFMPMFDCFVVVLALNEICLLDPRMISAIRITLYGSVQGTSLLITLIIECVLTLFRRMNILYCFWRYLEKVWFLYSVEITSRSI